MRVEEIAFQYLHRYRKGGHFVLHEGYHANEGKGFNDPGAKVSRQPAQPAAQSKQMFDSMRASSPLCPQSAVPVIHAFTRS